MSKFLVALPLVIMNLNELGMLLASLFMFTGMVCFQYEWSRNIMIALYIVGGFWWIAAGAM